MPDNIGKLELEISRNVCQNIAAFDIQNFLFSMKANEPKKFWIICKLAAKVPLAGLWVK